METLLGIILLVVDVWAIVKTLQSPARPGIKALWVLVILLLPVLGLLVWLLLGPRKAKF